MGKVYTKQLPILMPLVFWRVLVRRERKEKPDKSFRFEGEFERLDDHRRPKVAHIAWHQGQRARAWNHSSRKTARLSDCGERYYRTCKAQYLSGRSKDLAELSAITGAAIPWR